MTGLEGVLCGRARGAVNLPQCQSPAAEFLLQLPDDISDEIVKSPADTVGHLLHSCQPVPELWIHPLRLAAQQGGQFVQRRLQAAVEPLVNVPILVGKSRAVLHILISP